MNPKSLVDIALRSAQSQPITGTTPRDIHRDRSKRFVEALAHELRSFYQPSPTVRVLSRHYDVHRRDFGLNELLFDILVCETATVQSATESAQLTYVTKGIWAIESEFHRDSREAIYDFNKLVLAAADSALFIGPIVKEEASFLLPLSKPAEACRAHVYVALVPHPADWASMNLVSHAYEFTDGKWIALGT